MTRLATAPTTTSSSELATGYFFTPAAIHFIGVTLLKASINDPQIIKEAIVLTVASLLENISMLLGIKGNEVLF